MFVFRGAIVMTCLISLPLYLSAQDTSVSVFSGTVTDSKTGEHLQGVNVYLDGSTSGSSTDSLGKYVFHTSLTGSQQLVFSFMGYETDAKTVEISPGNSYALNSRLKLRTVTLDELEVVSSNKEWKHNFEFFKKEFLGRTDFSDQTEITNSWVLDFKKKNTALTATAQQPLIIINRALGYKIHTELVQFEWNTANRIGVYKVLNRFEELPNADNTQRARWLKNRVEAYYGSTTHFFKMLYEDNIDDSHYSLRNDRFLNHMSERELKSEFLTTGRGMYQIPKGLKCFKLEGRVQVVYNRTLRYQIDEESITSRLRKKSQMEPAKEDKLFCLNKMGLFEDPASVRVFGNWADDRMANELPLDYTHTQ